MAARASKQKVSDSVAIDAKRILLRYGAPIAVLDKVSEAHRIEFAREIAKTNLPEREPRLRQLMVVYGYDVDIQSLGNRGSSYVGAYVGCVRAALCIVC
jgi:hypothetical protein